MNKAKFSLLIAVAIFSLCACKEAGTKQTEVTISDVASGAAAKKQVTLELDIAEKNKITIPDPAKVQGDAIKIKLKKEPQDDTYKEEDYLADLSFAGFDKEVYVSSYVTGHMTSQEETASNCLALFVHESLLETDTSNHEKNYFLVLDYGNGTCYKTQTEFFLHYMGNWTELKAMDVTGDGKQELIASHVYNKSVEVGVFRCDEQTHKLVDLFSTLDDNEDEYVDRSWFSGHLEDGYKVVLEFPDIGYRETVSMIEDGGFEEKDLQVDNIDPDMDWNPVGLWKEGKLHAEKAAKEEEDIVFLYTLDHVDYVTGKEGNLQIELVRGIYVGHRAYGIGNMHMYLQYDAGSDRMVLNRVKYVDSKEAEKEWESFDEWQDQ